MVTLDMGILRKIKKFIFAEKRLCELYEKLEKEGFRLTHSSYVTHKKTKCYMNNLERANKLKEKMNRTKLKAVLNFFRG